MADESMTKQLMNLIEELRQVGQISHGFNKCEQLVADHQARIVILAADTAPFGFLIRIPLLCEDENIKYIYVERQSDLATACGKTKPVCAVAITFASEEFTAKMKDLSIEQRNSNDSINLKASQIEKEIEMLEAKIETMLDEGEIFDEADFIQWNDVYESCDESSVSSTEDFSDEEIEEMSAYIGVPE